MSTQGEAPPKVVPVRHYWSWVGAAVTVLLVTMVVHTLLSKVPTGTYRCASAHPFRHCVPRMEWRFGWTVVGKWFTSHEIVEGLKITMEATVMAMVIGIVLGVLIAVMRLSKNRILSSPAWAYTWFFRGTPVYVQILVWFNIAALYHSFRLGVPYTSWDFVHFSANSLSPLTVGVLALGLNEGAYMSEIARSGLISVDEGQIEAATSIGMTRAQTLRYVILPQAMRVIIPPTGNEVISMLKTTSLLSAIGITEILGAAENISATNYEVMQLLVTASLWYLMMTTILSIGQFYLERHFAKGALRTQPLTPLQRVRMDVRGVLSKFRTHPDVPKMRARST
jgi:polar amino acid transport system permease protein